MTEWRVPTKDAPHGRIRAVLERFPGVDYAFTQPIEMRVSEMLTGVRGDLAIKIFGADQGQLNQAAEAIVGVLNGIPGAQDVYTPRNDGRPVPEPGGRPTGGRSPGDRRGRPGRICCVPRSRA